MTPAAKSDMFVVLGITALLHGTNKAVQDCCKKLMPNATGSVCKALLRPLAASKDALLIVMEEMVYPQGRRPMGVVTRDGVEYDVTYHYRHSPAINGNEITALVTQEFISRGIHSGRIYFRLNLFGVREEYTNSIDIGKEMPNILRALS